MLPVLAVAVIFVLGAFLLFSLRILFAKNGTFRGTCAGNSPFLNKEGVVCGVCGKPPEEGCGKETEDEGITVKNPV